MAKARHGHAERKPPGRVRSPENSSRARERIAAQRAARRRAEVRRRILVAIASVTAVLAIVAGLVTVKLTSPSPVATESSAPPGLAMQATTVPTAVLSRVSGGQVATPLQSVKTPAPPLTIGGKPAIVFVSEESCPFCAAERWPLVVALSHFGTWSDLGSTRSSATDIYPDTATVSFRNPATRAGSRAAFHELTDNAAIPCRRRVSGHQAD